MNTEDLKIGAIISIDGQPPGIIENIEYHVQEDSDQNEEHFILLTNDFGTCYDVAIDARGEIKELARIQIPLCRTNLNLYGPANLVSLVLDIHYGITLGLCRIYYKKNQKTCNLWTDQEILEFIKCIKKQVNVGV